MFWSISSPLNLLFVFYFETIFTLLPISFRRYFSIFSLLEASENLSTCIYIIMYSRLHVPLYSQVACIITLNTNLNRRETIIWTHRAPSYCCPEKDLLAGSTNPDGIYIPCLACYHYMYWSSKFTYKVSSGRVAWYYALISSSAMIIFPKSLYRARKFWIHVWNHRLNNLLHTEHPLQWEDIHHSSFLITFFQSSW